MGVTANDILNIAKSWVGLNAGNGSHKVIIDTYNSVRPLPRGYKVKYTDSWCATFISALFIKAGAPNLISCECSCEQMINNMKKMGIFIENENRVPNVGDIIFYDWDDNGVGDCTGWSDHVGIVESVSGNNITIIEGNKSNAVGRRTIVVNQRYLRGYAVPKYSVPTTSRKDNTTIAKEVIAGKWGTGANRKTNLTRAGYDYNTIQQLVNSMLKGGLKDNTTIAKEVIAGKWGTGATRKTKLTNAGYDYNAIQKLVNSMLK